MYPFSSTEIKKKQNTNLFREKKERYTFYNSIRREV